MLSILLSCVLAATLAAPAVPMPNSRLTPGEVFARVTVAQICTPGYSERVRAVSASEKRQVYRRYGILHHARDSYEVDHLISLELGGDNGLRNLWPEPYAGPFGARTKDRLENYLHRQVCAGALPLAAAQREIARNWYQTWVQDGRP